ncbi:TetR/AcrR family transcriptional regulator [Actinomadura sp. BRA 177]|uniref:TetR/AcrR family transcriptional regulator n=1 Tax=Actinomadura sp. BRA 177 TaxID=2745202 RepID=UPI001595D00D|nr:TetR/AcrR family transcriptional regulator [Actinomadura sp. BRA 177]NVI88166.1 TetR/AcrR family transcriptional regulator [Actinomadura sp. BRA 177]
MTGSRLADNPGSGRVQRRRGRRTREILTTAAELFGERGYDAVSLEDVAERLDVTKGSLYYYFRSKGELGTAAIEALGNDWTERLEQLPAARTGPPSERLRALLQEHISIAVREYPAALRLFLVPRDWPADTAARIKDLRRRHNQIFRTVIEEGVRSGEFTVTGIGTTLQCMHAAMSQASTWCTRLPEPDRATAIDELTETLMMLVGQPPNSDATI